MYDKFTDRARKVIALAREEAVRIGNDYLGTEHILLGIIKDGGGIAAAVLESLNIDLEKLRVETEDRIIDSAGATMLAGEIPFMPQTKKVFELAAEESQVLGHNYIGTEHLLLGLLKEGEGIAARVLIETGINYRKAKEMTINILGTSAPAKYSASHFNQKSTTPTL
ncbi:MAG: NDP-hexose 4-ketoreductase, partial [Spirochaetia bacterium]|nr:NDP-hexose 4-ketoreductase [Spirochaetia bacterium]